MSKFARRFVMAPTVIADPEHLYVGSGTEGAALQPRPGAPSRRTTMKYKLLTTLGVITMALTATQFAAAGERHSVRKPVRATATEQFRNANAAWSVPSAQPDIYRYSSGWSAPAGH
jgi:hypothetical protein